MRNLNPALEPVILGRAVGGFVRFGHLQRFAEGEQESHPGEEVLIYLIRHFFYFSCSGAEVDNCTTPVPRAIIADQKAA
jgi:hypothetical protein